MTTTARSKPYCAVDGVFVGSWTGSRSPLTLVNFKGIPPHCGRSGIPQRGEYGYGAYPSLDIRASWPGCVPALRRRPCSLLYRSDSSGIPAPARTVEKATTAARPDLHRGEPRRPRGRGPTSWSATRGVGLRSKNLKRRGLQSPLLRRVLLGSTVRPMGRILLSRFDKLCKPVEPLLELANNPLQVLHHEARLYPECLAALRAGYPKLPLFRVHSVYAIMID